MFLLQAGLLAVETALQLQSETLNLPVLKAGVTDSQPAPAELRAALAKVARDAKLREKDAALFSDDDA